MICDFCIKDIPQHDLLLVLNIILSLSMSKIPNLRYEAIGSHLDVGLLSEWQINGFEWPANVM